MTDPIKALKSKPTKTVTRKNYSSWAVSLIARFLQKIRMETCYYTIQSDKKKGGPALHVHHFQDEWFYVIKGEFIVKVGDETFTLSPGDSAFAPRSVPHAFAKTSDGEAQMLIAFQPAGTMEDFFLQMSKLGQSIPKNQQEVLKELWSTHGMEVVGAPLKF